MLKKDAIVKDSDGEICTVSFVHDYGITVEYGGRHSEDSDLLEHGTYEVLEDIRSMHEQQKQRADALEKRWEKLKTLLDRLWKFGDADTHEVAYDLLIRIKQLEEDGE